MNQMISQQNNFRGNIAKTRQQQQQNKIENSGRMRSDPTWYSAATGFKSRIGDRATSLKVPLQ
jgi:hypothetical protein